MTNSVSSPHAIVGVNSSFSNLLPWILLILFCAGLIRLLKMAGKEGWKAIIPGYNLWVLSSIIKLPPLSILLFLVPYVNVIYTIVFMAKLAKAYRRGFLMTVLLIICPPIAIFMLGYSSKTKYVG